MRDDDADTDDDDDDFEEQWCVFKRGKQVRRPSQLFHLPNCINIANYKIKLLYAVNTVNTITSR